MLSVRYLESCESNRIENFRRWESCKAYKLSPKSPFPFNAFTGYKNLPSKEIIISQHIDTITNVIIAILDKDFHNVRTCRCKIRFFRSVIHRSFEIYLSSLIPTKKKKYFLEFFHNPSSVVVWHSNCSVLWFAKSQFYHEICVRNNILVGNSSSHVRTENNIQIKWIDRERIRGSFFS